MTDSYLNFVNSPFGARIARALGLPKPEVLRRLRADHVAQADRAEFDRLIVLGAGPAPQLFDALANVIAHLGATSVAHAGASAWLPLANRHGLMSGRFEPVEAGSPARVGALIFDATGIDEIGQLDSAYAFFHDALRSLDRSGRIVVLGRPPEACDAPRQWTAQRALEGLVRSLGKEARRGIAANLVYVASGAEAEIGAGIEATLRFFLSPRSAYVSGQVVRIGRAAKIDGVAAGTAVASPDASASGMPTSGASAASRLASVSEGSTASAAETAGIAGIARTALYPAPLAPPALDWSRPLAGKRAVVTGAARGIGAAIAEVLAAQGAQVIGIDIPAAREALEATLRPLSGTALPCDIAAADAPAQIAAALDELGVDVLVHNAGITRDKTIARMTEAAWHDVLDINLGAQQRIDEALLAAGTLRDGGRIICVSSISGIAGNSGQTHYAASKAGVIGRVESMAPRLAERGITINAVAPGFIETQMTAKMPLLIREAGRRMNSMRQGGQPVDVAHAIAWLAHPGCAGVTGQLVRVCGQSLIGA